MYYLVTVGYETEQENGRIKVLKEKYIIEAESVEEATIVASKYREGDIRSSESLSVMKMPIQLVIEKKTTPEYYK